MVVTKRPCNPEGREHKLESVAKVTGGHRPGSARPDVLGPTCRI